MKALNERELQQVRQRLFQAGVTHPALLDELTDHVSCDLEKYCSEGLSFDDAWQETMATIPSHYLTTLQIETMESIYPRMVWLRSLTYFSLVLYFFSLLFKVLHYPGAGVMLWLGWGGMITALSLFSIAGMVRYKDMKGGWPMLAAVFGMALALAGYTFGIMHWPGANSLINTGAIVLFLSLLVGTIYVFRQGPTSRNLVTYLHERYTPQIERVSIIILIPVLVVNTLYLLGRILPWIDTVFFQVSWRSMGSVQLILLALISCIHFIPLVWRATMQSAVRWQQGVLLSGIVISLWCISMLLTRDVFTVAARFWVLLTFLMVAGVVAFLGETFRASSQRMVALALIILVPFIYFVMHHLSAKPISMGVGVYISMLMVLIAGLFACKRHGVMRAYMIISLGTILSLSLHYI